jgi:hypothetical protein
MEATPHRSIAAITKPTLLLSTALGIGVLAYGLHQQAAVVIEPQHVSGRTNPWRGLQGCVYLKNNDQKTHLRTGIASNAACEGDQAAAVTGLSAQSQDLVVGLQPLIAAPATSLPIDRAGNKAPNVVNINGKLIAKGPDIGITLDAAHQHVAQMIAECMTGSHDKCGEQIAHTWSGHYEGAAARMLALVEIDIATGGILAMASAHSPCYAAHWSMSKTPPSDGCPTLPTINAPQRWRLDNHSRFTTAMPGSIDKPALMLALLRSSVGPSLRQGRGRQWVIDTLKTSNSAELFDKLFCAEGNFDASCDRLGGLTRAAYDLGFNGGYIDLLNENATSRFYVPNSRLLMEKGANDNWNWLSTAMPESSLLAQCSASKWQKCAGEDTAKIVSELWGQGNAQATALSAAHMIARLGAAANGANIAPPHLLSTAANANVRPAGKRTGIQRQDARLITEGMTHVGRPGGTAHSACVAVMGLSACQQMNFVALKTGTPAFTHDRLTMNERVTVCENAAAEIEAARDLGNKVPAATVTENARCHMQPNKWTIALIKDSDATDAPYSRAVAVLAERNYKLDGHIDSAYDRGINVAAELLFRYVKRTRASSH